MNSNLHPTEAPATVDLEKDNRRLREYVETLVRHGEENHQIQQHFHQFEFSLLACTRLRELLDTLLLSSQGYFDLASTSLVIYDPDYSLQDLLSFLEVPSYDNHFQIRHNNTSLIELYGTEPKVILGEMDALATARFFPGCPAVKSIACLPLVRYETIMGSLQFGSDSKERFTPDKAVDFLFHLASVVAVCLENCISREHLERQGHMDMLTQVRNRRSFDLEYVKELERAQRSSESLTCMFVDVDHFKKFNDSYGHQVGDLCLKEVAKASQEQLRKTDLLARYGGEEFVGILPSCAETQAANIAERIRAAVEAIDIEVGKKEKVHPTVSVGLSTWHPLEHRLTDIAHIGERLLGSADEAMYKAKQFGRNRVYVQGFREL